MTELDLLHDYLDGNRRHILGAVEGLDDATLRRAVLPSDWTPLGLIQHLAVDVERFWFRAIIAGDPALFADYPQRYAGNAWLVDPDVPAASVLDTYRAEAEQANQVLRDRPLDAAPGWWPVEQLGDWRMESVRQIALHVLEETATHAGHLDAARELIDGHQHTVLT